jgi:iron uptake system component EfeO
VTRLAALAATLAAAALLVACGAGDDKKGGQTIPVTLGPDGCPTRLTVPSGSTTFEITNKGSDVTEFEVLQGERILAERENITDGLSGSFTLELKTGRYGIRCAATGPQGTLIVTG